LVGRGLHGSRLEEQAASPPHCDQRCLPPEQRELGRAAEGSGQSIAGSIPPPALRCRKRARQSFGGEWSPRHQDVVLIPPPVVLKFQNGTTRNQNPRKTNRLQLH